jgi:hypothetical protein
LTYIREPGEEAPLEAICGGNYEMLTSTACRHVPPSPYTLQNLENKGAEKILPRKILQPKELDLKSCIQITYGRIPDLSSQNPLSAFGAPNRVNVNQGNKSGFLFSP